MFTSKNKIFITSVLAFSMLFTSSCQSGGGTEKETLYFTITWNNYDGTKLNETRVKEGEVPIYSGKSPKKESTDSSTYTFKCWSPEIVPAVEDTTYTAVFDEKAITYKVTFKNWDETELASSSVKRGEVAVYKGITPSKPKDKKFTYTFNDWNPKIGPVYCNQVYRATFDAHQYSYDVKWANYDGSILETDTGLSFGDMPHYDGDTPTKPADAVGVNYIFTGWSPEIHEVNEDITYTALFVKDTSEYKVQFNNYDGTPLETAYFNAGEMPQYSGSTPTKPHDENTFYVFDGWDKELKPVTEDTVYVAKFKEVDSYFYNGSKTTYKLVYNADSSGNSYAAASYFKKYFGNFTNLTLQLLDETSLGQYDNDADYIYFGRTNAAKARNLHEFSSDAQEKSDYYINIDKRAVIVDGGSLGLTYGAVDLLKQMFDFDYLAPGDNDYWFDSSKTSIGISDIKEKYFDPLINYRTNYASGEIRFAGTNDYAKALMCSGDSPFITYTTIEGVDDNSIRYSQQHNTMQYLPYEYYKNSHPDWFNSDHSQICMSHVYESEQAMDIIYRKLVKISAKNPGKLLSFEHMDNWVDANGHYCSCSKCLSYYRKYGNDVGIYLLILNKLGDMIKEGQSKGEITSNVPGITGLAYYGTNYACPYHEDLVAHDNVYMELAPSFHNRMRSWKESETSYFDDWNKLLHKNISQGYFYSLDDYSTANYLYFHNDFDTLYDNYEIYRNEGLDCIIQLGCWNNPGDTGFGLLRAYLYSYLTSNNTTTREEYEQQIDNFFTRYYGKASSKMRELFDLLRRRWNDLKVIKTKKDPNGDRHCSITRLNSLVTDSDGYSYGIAANYDKLTSVAASKQKALFSNNDSDYYCIENHIKLVDEALEAISVYGNTSSTYKKYEKRVLKDALCVAYILLECYNGSCNFFNKQTFINFCKTNRLEKYTEGQDMSVLASRWGVTY